MHPTYTFHPGSLPMLVSVPHAGTEVPRELLRRFTSTAQLLPDTDWYVDKLYECARAMGASMLVANCSRYVVDLNRSPDSAPLYADSPTSPICPMHTFGGDAIYMSGDEPTANEIEARIEQYWRLYHQCLESELQRLREAHGIALLWEAHSVASEVPGLFEGVLPEFNLGTRDDSSCPRQIAEALLKVVTEDGKYGAVLNGRFKGGYTTLKYGQPSRGIYGVQLELSQRVYMDESTPLQWDAERAGGAVQIISKLLACYLDESRAYGGKA
jgi:N-formylglutamate deformylase